MSERLILGSGSLKAEFVCDENGWTPGWFYEEEGKPLLRFKDHEWLSLGRVVTVTHAEKVEKGEGRAVFSGKTEILGCPVRWQVTVEAAPGADGFFRVHSQIDPDELIELVEAFTFFETPYDYDGSEQSTVLLGANPATVWDGDKPLTPPKWNNPEWVYQREEAARMTYPAHLPTIFHRLRAQDGSERYVSLAANFDVCPFKEIFVTPTRTVRDNTNDYWDFKRDKLRGYKYTAGALNWSGSYVKDPNVGIAKGGMAQEVLVSASSACPGDGIDAAMMRLWEVSYAQHNDGERLPVGLLYEENGASWQKAADWLEKSLAVPGTTKMVDEETGCIDYVVGTRPLSNYCYGKGWRFYFQKHALALIRYRARVLHNKELDARLDKLEEKLMGLGYKPFEWPQGDTGKPANLMQSCGYIAAWAVAPDTALGRAASPEASGIDISKIIREVLDDEDHTHGIYVKTLEPLKEFLTAETLDKGWSEALAKIDNGLQEWLWDFPYFKRSQIWISGGQASPAMFSAAAGLFGRAYQVSGEEKYARAYARAVNLQIGWCYHTFNDSPAEDLDYRGMAHAALAGRDQLADLPPMENTGLLHSLSHLDHIPEKFISRGWLDCVWLMSQTGLCQSPAARTTKRLFGPGLHPQIHPLKEVATERYYVEHYPWMGYENPVDQTLIATYMSLAPPVADLVYGGRLASAGPEVLTLVPRAGRRDTAEYTERKVLVYNPKNRPHEGTCRIVQPGGEVVEKPVALEARSWQWL